MRKSGEGIVLFSFKLFFVIFQLPHGLDNLDEVKAMGAHKVRLLRDERDASCFLAKAKEGSRLVDDILSFFDEDIGGEVETLSLNDEGRLKRVPGLFEEFCEMSPCGMESRWGPFKINEGLLDQIYLADNEGMIGFLQHIGGRSNLYRLGVAPANHTQDDFQKVWVKPNEPQYGVLYPRYRALIDFNQKLVPKAEVIVDSRNGEGKFKILVDFLETYIASMSFQVTLSCTPSEIIFFDRISPLLSLVSRNASVAYGKTCKWDMRQIRLIYADGIFGRPLDRFNSFKEYYDELLAKWSPLFVIDSEDPIDCFLLQLGAFSRPPARPRVIINRIGLKVTAKLAVELRRLNSNPPYRNLFLVCLALALRAYHKTLPITLPSVEESEKNFLEVAKSGYDGTWYCQGETITCRNVLLRLLNNGLFHSLAVYDFPVNVIVLCEDWLRHEIVHPYFETTADEFERRKMEGFLKWAEDEIFKPNPFTACASS